MSAETTSNGALDNVHANSLRQRQQIGVMPRGWDGDAFRGLMDCKCPRWDAVLEQQYGEGSCGRLQSSEFVLAPLTLSASRGRPQRGTFIDPSAIPSASFESMTA